MECHFVMLSGVYERSKGVKESHLHASICHVVFPSNSHHLTIYVFSSEGTQFPVKLLHPVESKIYNAQTNILTFCNKKKNSFILTRWYRYLYQIRQRSINICGIFHSDLTFTSQKVLFGSIISTSSRWSWLWEVQQSTSIAIFPAAVNMLARMLSLLKNFIVKKIILKNGNSILLLLRTLLRLVELVYAHSI